jgi:hypothetical protein
MVLKGGGGRVERNTLCVCMERFFICRIQLKSSLFSSVELRATEPHPVGLCLLPLPRKVPSILSKVYTFTLKEILFASGCI